MCERTSRGCFRNGEICLKIGILTSSNFASVGLTRGCRAAIRRRPSSDQGWVRKLTLSSGLARQRIKAGGTKPAVFICRFWQRNEAGRSRRDGGLPCPHACRAQPLNTSRLGRAATAAGRLSLAPAGAVATGGERQGPSTPLQHAARVRPRSALLSERYLLIAAFHMSTITVQKAMPMVQATTK